MTPAALRTRAGHPHAIAPHRRPARIADDLRRRIARRLPRRSRSTLPCSASSLVLAVGLLALAGPAAARAADRTIAYSIAQRGEVGADLAEFARMVHVTLNDPRGWSLGGSIRFDRVDCRAGGRPAHVRGPDLDDVVEAADERRGRRRLDASGARPRLPGLQEPRAVVLHPRQHEEDGRSLHVLPAGRREDRACRRGPVGLPLRLRTRLRLTAGRTARCWAR